MNIVRMRRIYRILYYYYFIKLLFVLYDSVRDLTKTSQENIFLPEPETALLFADEQ